MAAKRVAVALSGGVDSLCALLLLKEQGFSIIAVHGLFASPLKTDLPFSIKAACLSLGIDLEIIDLTEKFSDAVVRTFANAYFAGLTPNPCATCNREIKFGALMDAAFALGADLFATGHYCGLVPSPYAGQAPLLAPAADPCKDQAYFLALVPGARLERVIFPLAGLTKSQARRIVAARGLTPPVVTESQDICFLPKGRHSYADFLKTAGANPRPGPGPVYLSRKNSPKIRIGSHNGLWNHTEGQRRGLGIPWPEPLYVLAKDAATNSLIVGPKAETGMNGCLAGQTNFFVDPAQWPKQLKARARSTRIPVEANVEISGARLKVTLDQKEPPTAPGQVAAIYDMAGRVLAGGIVEKVW